MFRMIGKLFAILAIGAGTGTLTWGITAASLGEPIHPAWEATGVLTAASEVIGCGAGLLAAGITALVLSLVGGCKK